MSDTPETNSIIRNAQAADHPPTRLAATLTVKCGKLERERDEAREILQAVIKTGKRLERERDEAREKYATEATEHMLAINKLCNERDEAREALNKILKNE